MWLIGSVVVGVIAAVLAGRFMSGNGFGLAGNVIAAVVGAVAGGYLLYAAGLDLGGGLIGRLLAAAIGAALALLLVQALTRPRQRNRSS